MHGRHGNSFMLSSRPGYFVTFVDFVVYYLLRCVDYHKTNNEMHEKSFMLSSGLVISCLSWISLFIVSCVDYHKTNNEIPGRHGKSFMLSSKPGYFVDFVVYYLLR